MLIQDLNYIETVEENVEGGATVSGFLNAGGKVTYGSIGGSASDYELDVSKGFSKGFIGFSLSEDLEQAGGALEAFTVGKGGGFNGGLTIIANA